MENNDNLKKFKQLISEEIEKLHRQTLLENRKCEIEKELFLLNERWSPDQQEDAFITSDGNKYSVSVSGKFISETDTMSKALGTVRMWMDQRNYHPTLWFVSDHGNYWPIDSQGNEIKDVEKASVRSLNEEETREPRTNEMKMSDGWIDFYQNDFPGENKHRTKKVFESDDQKKLDDFFSIVHQWGVYTGLQDNRFGLIIRNDQSLKDEVDELFNKMVLGGDDSVVSESDDVDDSFDWRAMTYAEKVTLTRESGLPDSVASKEVGMITPEEMSKLRNSIRLRKITGISETKDVKAMYRKAGMKPPHPGKGIHTKKFHKCVTSVGDKGGKNPYAICMASLGKEKAVKKSHQTEGNDIEIKYYGTNSVV